MNTQGEQLFGFNESQGFGHFGALHELELQQQRDQIVVNNSTIRGHPVAVTTGVSAASSRGGTNVCNSPNMSGATPTGRNTTTATGSSSRRKSGGKLSVLSDSQGALDGGAGWMFGEDDKHGSAHGAHGTAALMAKEQSSQVVAFDHYATKNRSSDVGVGGEFGDAASKTATAGGNRGSKAKTPKSSN